MNFSLILSLFKNMILSFFYFFVLKINVNVLQIGIKSLIDKGLQEYSMCCKIILLCCINIYYHYPSSVKVYY